MPTYSALSNCSVYTAIYFDGKILPTRAYLILHDYLQFQFSLSNGQILQFPLLV